MNPLASRKKLLVAESELNRAQMMQDWQTLAGDFQVVGDQARTLGSLAAVAATLAVAWIAFRRQQSDPQKTGWLQKLLHGAGLAKMLWAHLRPHARKPDGK